MKGKEGGRGGGGGKEKGKEESEGYGLGGEGANCADSRLLVRITYDCDAAKTKKRNIICI